MKIKKYDLKINSDIVSDIRTYFDGNKSMEKFSTSINIEVDNKLEVKLLLKDVGYDDTKAIQINLDTGFANYLNVLSSFNELFNLIEIRRETETVVFKPILSNEITFEYMIERAKALNEIKKSENLFTNLIMVNDFTNELELYEVLYLFLILPKNIKKDKVELLKDKLAYYGYDEDNIYLDDEEMLPIEELMMDLALNKIYNLKAFGDSDLEKDYLFTVYKTFLEWFYEHKIK